MEATTDLRAGHHDHLGGLLVASVGEPVESAFCFAQWGEGGLGGAAGSQYPAKLGVRDRGVVIGPGVGGLTGGEVLVEQSLSGGNRGGQLTSLEHTFSSCYRRLVAGAAPAGQLVGGPFADAHRVGEGARLAQLLQEAFYERRESHDLLGWLVIGQPIQQG